MKAHKFLLIALFLISTPLLAQERISPGVPDLGGIFEMPEEVYHPNSNLDYKIVVDVSAGAQDPAKVNPGLHNLARLINLHVAGGIPLENLEVVAVFHGGATSIVLDNATYKENHGVDNPNLEYFKALTEAGMKFFVCGQSVTYRGYNFEDLNEYVTPSYSAMTIMTEHQLKGFAALKFD
ncbi:MAG: DsrE family protein [Bacteroidota bacterium]